eukprot:COSAG01_NODE_41264_length_453_cov_6.240113_1_plen_54_part_00
MADVTQLGQLAMVELAVVEMPKATATATVPLDLSTCSRTELDLCSTADKGKLG